VIRVEFRMGKTIRSELKTTDLPRGLRHYHLKSLEQIDLKFFDNFKEGELETRIGDEDLHKKISKYLD
jgi:hypothetical protein